MKTAFDQPKSPEDIAFLTELLLPSKGKEPEHMTPDELKAALLAIAESGVADHINPNLAADVKAQNNVSPMELNMYRDELLSQYGIVKPRKKMTEKTVLQVSSLRAREGFSDDILKNVDLYYNATGTIGDQRYT